MSSLFRKSNLKNIIGLSLVVFGTVTSIVYAVNTPNFTLQINPGTLSIDIVDPSDYSTKTNPSFSIGGTSTFSSMTSVTATGVLGDDTNGVIYISNPDATSSWTASLAANTTQWTTGGATPSVFPYNAVTSAQGQLTIDPSTATLTSGKSNIVLDSSVTLGSSGTFSDKVSSVTLAQANASAPRIADFVIKNIGVNQVIPAMTSSGSYSLGITLSIIGDGTSTGPTVTYNGKNVSNGNIYVDNSSFDLLNLYSSDPSTVWSSNYLGDYRTVYSDSNQSSIYDGSATSNIYVFSQSYASPEDVIYTATSSSGVTNITVHYGTGKDCGSGVWVNNGAACPAPTINYAGQDISNNGDIYVAANFRSWAYSSDPLTVWDSNLSNDVNSWRGIDSYSGHYWVFYGSDSYYSLISSNLEQQSVFLGAEDAYVDSGSISPANITYTATGVDGSVTTFTVHYGTGKYCSSNDTWISNSATCPIFG